MIAGTVAKFWAGDEWQEYILLLLKRHYGPAHFQEIPDKDQGDCGLEGFSRDGSAYQCYSAQEPLSIADLTAKQKTKVTKDIKKFRDNSVQLRGLLGGTKIGRWILVVPRFDSKDLLVHTAKKAEEVRKAAPAHVQASFEIHVIKDDHFAVERAALYDSGAGKVTIDVAEAAEKDVKEWAGKNDKLVKAIDEKLGRITAVKASAKKGIRDKFLRHYVTGQNLLERLRIDFPALHEKVLACQRARERFLSTRMALCGPTTGTALHEVISQFRDELDRSVTGISDSNAECLAFGAVADWMLRCPLDFPEA